jgi:hypothetical protein
MEPVEFECDGQLRTLYARSEYEKGEECIECASKRPVSVNGYCFACDRHALAEVVKTMGVS